MAFPVHPNGGKRNVYSLRRTGRARPQGPRVQESDRLPHAAGSAALDGVDDAAKEQLAGARNLFRQTEPIHSEMAERVETVLTTDLGSWLLVWGEPPYAHIVDEAMIVADMLSNVGETESKP